MACSHCGGANHNIQTCPSVRRCSVCHKRGHDRRNCPHVPREPRPPAVQQGPPPPPPSIPPDGRYERLRRICASESGLLAHLYWPNREHFFETSRSAYLLGEGWLLKATQWHGVSRPERPTINFLVADETWLNSYASAAEARGVHHGILIRRATIEQIAHHRGFEFAEVTVGHPSGRGVVDPAEFWKFDIGNHRYAVLHEMRFCTVARLATPEADSQRSIILPNQDIIACW